MEERTRRHGIFFPLLLILAGGLLLLNNLGLIQGSMGSWTRYWPLLLIAGGLDDIYRGKRGWIAPVVWIGLGAVFLLSNLGLLAWSPWSLFLKLWPVLIIALGLDLVIGTRRGWGALVGLVVGLALIAGIVWFAARPILTGTVETQKISQTLDKAEQAKMTIAISAGQLNLAGGAEAGLLIAGQGQTGKGDSIETSYSVTGGKGEYELKETGVTVTPYFGAGDPMKWELKASSAVPLDLTVKAGAGELNLDLRKLKVETLTVNMAVGKTTLILPAGGKLDGKYNGAVGDLVVMAPKGAAVRIKAGLGISSLAMPDGWKRAEGYITSPGAGSEAPLQLDLTQAVGAVTIRYTE